MKTSLEKISYLVFYSLKARFKDTFAGFIWVILNPIITYLVHCFLLIKILHLQIPNVFVFLLGGILPWSFFSNSIEMSSGKLNNFRDTMHSFHLKPSTLIWATLLENFILFSITFCLLVTIQFFYNNLKLSPAYLLLPIYLINFLFFSYYVALSISILNIIYKDVKFLSSFTLNLVFFLTPLLYPEHFFPEKFKFLIYLNPIYQTLLPIRSILISEMQYSDSLTYIKPFITTGLSFLFYYFIFSKYKKDLFKKI